VPHNYSFDILISFNVLVFFIYFLGRHPCAGMKFAKLMLKLILAMILVGYEYELVDGNGDHPKTLPEQDRNDLQQVSPPCAIFASR